MKTTRKQIDHKLETLNRLLGRPVVTYVNEGGKYTPQIGNLHIDGSGYQIAEMREGGGISHPLGDGVFSASECWAVLNAACAAVKMAKGKL